MKYMVDVTVHYTDEELSKLLDVLNWGYLLCCDLYNGYKFGCEIPNKFTKLFENKTDDEVDAYMSDRLEIYRKLYDYLLEFETHYHYTKLCDDYCKKKEQNQ